jgi:glycosyltransferase involved in cell wall biosynthesis
MLTIAVCTRNRVAKLPNLLDSLARMEVPQGVDWELIVVDNGSTDATAAVLQDFAARRVLPIRCGFEPRPGLSTARNHALNLARGEVIAFTDDDCCVAKDWLAVLARTFAGDQALQLLGGRVELFNPADQPLSVRTGRTPLDLTGKPEALNVFIGCNLAFRCEVVRRVGAFDPRLGPGSGHAPGWDDLEFVYRLVRLGVPLRYSPDWLVYHDHCRATDAQAEALRRSYMRGRGAFYAKHALRGDRVVLRMLRWDLAALLRGVLRRRGRADSAAMLAALLAGFAQYVFGRGT